MAEKPKDAKFSAPAAALTSAQLDTSKADRRVWMMKCPPVVARAMQSNTTHHQPPPPLPSDPSAGQIFAKVVVAVDPLHPNDDLSSTQFTCVFTMELAGIGDRNLLKRYSMAMSTDFIPMSVLSESSQGKPSVEGTINHKFDMKPHSENIEDYGRYCRERTNKSMAKPRQTREKKSQAKGSESKRTRKDPEEMEKIMFRLFEKKPNWTLKQLVQNTDQPEQFLKDMLKSLCVYNNKGANQGTYELKPEYRTDETPDAS
ncbi:hypothetical protein SASPL_139163 [Salvia splendens]|uniref:TFIIF beta subunit HTH domain-containing protein n=1 Tax=Salvia splendens TaxID=180675 RepID=A0A8X8WUT1_SALSN|nr:hypothetical protein SASPL_139163 [Salvia splendens]